MIGFVGWLRSIGLRPSIPLLWLLILGLAGPTLAFSSESRLQYSGSSAVSAKWQTAFSRLSDLLWANLDILQLIGGFLLGHAVKRSQAPDEVNRVDTYDSAFGEKLAQDTESNAVIRVVESWDEDAVVGDVEVSVTGRQPLSFEYQGSWHRQKDYFGTTAVLEPGTLEPFTIFFEKRVVFVSRIALPAEDNGIGGNKSAEVVDMPVGIVTHDAAAEPDNIIRPKMVIESGLDILSREARVARLNFLIEQTLLGRHDSPASVDVDRSALKDERSRAGLGVKKLSSQNLGRRGGYLPIQVVVGVLGPCIKVKVDDRGLSSRFWDEYGSGVPGPAPVSRQLEKFHSPEICAHFGQHPRGSLLLHGGVDDNSYLLEGRTCFGTKARRGQIPNDLSVNPRDRSKFSGPVALVMRPREPGRLMGLPFGGHAIAELGRSFSHR
jgi:hypothetical protein